MVLALWQVLKRLLTTLACLGVSHVHITGAEKVEPVYYGATALLPHNILPQLITGTISSNAQLPWTVLCMQCYQCLWVCANVAMLPHHILPQLITGISSSSAQLPQNVLCMQCYQCLWV